MAGKDPTPTSPNRTCMKVETTLPTGAVTEGPALPAGDAINLAAEVRKEHREWPTIAKPTPCP
jgi:hypothetical protein